MSVGHASQCRPKTLEQQPENVLALALIPAPSTGVVMEDGAGSAAIKTAAHSMIEIVGDHLHRQGKIGRHRSGPLFALGQGGFEVADAFLHGAVVARTMWRTVQVEHAEAGQDFIHMVVVERRAVVAFEDQGRAVFAEEAFEMAGDLLAIELVSDEWAKAIA